MLLKKLTALSGVSGCEDEVRQFIWKRAGERADRVIIDSLGSVIAIKEGEKHADRTVLVDAHMDEAGLMVCGVDDRGLLHFVPVGSLDARILPSCRVLVGSNRVPGVIGARAVHLQEKEEWEKPVPLEKMVIDIGASSREEAERAVSVGDTAVFDGKWTVFGDGLVKARALDNRAGCAMLLSALGERYPVTLAAVFSSREEIGGLGARTASHRLRPDAALILEGTTCAHMHGVPDHLRVTRIGGGPAVTPMEPSVIASPELLSLIREAAERDGIAWQYRKGNVGGTDGGPVQQARAGIPVAHIAIPCRYIHSGVSVMSLADFENGKRLLRATLSQAHRLFKKED